MRIVLLIVVGLCVQKSLAESFLIPPREPELEQSVYKAVDQYLNNELEQYQLNALILNKAEDFCVEKIQKHENVSWYESQLLKIHFDRLFLRKYNNPSWLKKQIIRDRKRLAEILQEKKRKKLIEKILHFEEHLQILTRKKASIK
ncbi:MAG: hypothetical protein GF397_04875 [Elusimicrobia bacterium]|nr:hypothetical protein [Elusimicrobiota bacterium]